MNDVDRDIAELLAYRGRLAIGHWSENIAAALALVAQLEIDLTLGYWPPLEEWQAFLAGKESYDSAPADTPAEAVALAIRAWLRARERKL